jgi:GT2 family glycosyltransferase
VFDRAALEQVGGFDEELVRNQDYDLNWRLREAGHVVWLDPELVVDYSPRATIGSLASQYFQYGLWKRQMLRRHPRSIQPRQVVAPLLVIGLIISVVELIRGRLRGLLVPLAYVNSALLVARDARAELTSRTDRWRMVGVFATMHLAWGAGFLLGRARRPANG